MPAVIPIVAAVAGAAVSASASKSAAKKSANAQTQASDAAIAAQVAAREQMRGDLMPWMQAGQGSLAALAQANAGDYSGFMNNPAYLYGRDEAQYAVEHGAASKGSLYSGGTDLDLARHINGLAAQNYNTWNAQQMGLAQLGQVSAAGVGASGMGSANQVGGYLQNAGDARASAYQQAGGATAGLATGIAGAIGNYYAGQPTQSSYSAPPANNFGVPGPVAPYQNTGYGYSNGWG